MITAHLRSLCPINTTMPGMLFKYVDVMLALFPVQPTFVNSFYTCVEPICCWHLRWSPQPDEASASMMHLILAVDMLTNTHDKPATPKK
jgi:hypothetical protein